MDHSLELATEPDSSQLAAAWQAYELSGHDPQALTRVHQMLWDQRAGSVQRQVAVTPCPYSADELAAMEQLGNRPGYLPAEFATQESRHLLSEIFPKLRSYAVLEDNVVTNDSNPSGWFDYETSVGCPYLHTTESELFDQVDADGRVLLNLNQYIVASLDSRVLTGQYLDEAGTWIRTGSRVGGRIASARFDGDEMAPGLGDELPVEGCLLIGYDLGSDDFGPSHGGRSSAVRLERRGVIAGASPARTVVRPLAVIAERLAVRDPDAEWNRITSQMLSNGYHHELGMSSQQYLASLPRLLPAPESYLGRLDVPLVVETRIGWERLAELSGVGLPGPAYTPTVDYEPTDDRARTPAGPYTGWFGDWGIRFPQPTSPPDAREQLADDEVGGSILELIAMHVAHPELNTNGRFLDAVGWILPEEQYLPGLTYEHSEFRSPGLYNWRSRPEIGANMHPRAFAIFRPLVRGSLITVNAVNTGNAANAVPSP